MSIDAIIFAHCTGDASASDLYLRAAINDAFEQAESPERLRDAVAGALVSRGKNAGCLTATCPPMGTDAAIAWQALTSVFNPSKAGRVHLMLCDDQDFLAECQDFADDLPVIVGRSLDCDRRAFGGNTAGQEVGQ